MNIDRVIAERDDKTIYLDGDRCIKMFNEQYSKADVLNEALNQARIEETDINTPKIIEVTVHNNKWAIVYEHIEGTTLAQLMEENPEKAMWYAVNGMLPNNSIGRKAITRLKVYANETHNHEAQNPVAWTGEIK
jgi:aminoglycoside phosphotransferase